MSLRGPSKIKYIKNIIIIILFIFQIGIAFSISVEIKTEQSLQGENEIEFADNNYNFKPSLVQPSHVPITDDFLYYKEITINYQKVVGTTNYVNFPIVLDIIDSDLKDNAQADGSDIRFTNDTDYLPYYIEHYDPHYSATEAKLVAWISIPELRHDIDTVIYMYYGNETISSNCNPDLVWDENYMGVWHMNNNPSEAAPQIKDKSSNENHGTVHGGLNTNNLVQGKIGDSIEFYQGSPFQYISCENEDENDATLDITEELTIELWVNFNGNIPAVITPSIIQKADENNKGWRIYRDKGQAISFSYEDEFSNTKKLFNSESFPGKKWYYIALSFSIQNDYALLFFNSNHYLETSSLTKMASNSQPLIMGDLFEGGKFEGLIDEVRISSIARPKGWIETTYKNQYTPNEFYSIGPHTEIGSEAPEIPEIIEIITIPPTLELGDTEIIRVNVKDIGKSIQVLIEIEGVNFTLENRGNGMFEFDSWIPKTPGTMNFVIHVEDMAGNSNSAVGSFEVEDTTPPPPPNIHKAPNNTIVEESFVFKWYQGSDPSGIKEYQLIISMDSDINNKDAYVLNMWIPNTGQETVQFTYEGDFDSGEYHYFVLQKDGSGLLSSPTIGSFIVLEENQNPDLNPDSDPISNNNENDLIENSSLNDNMIYLIAGLVGAFIVSVAGYRHKVRSIINDDPKYHHRVPLRFLRAHAEQIEQPVIETTKRNSQKTVKLKNEPIVEKPKNIETKQNILREVYDEIDKTITQKLKSATELYLEGAYIEAQQEFEKIAYFLIENGREEEGEKYLNRAQMIKNIMQRRQTIIETVENGDIHHAKALGLYEKCIEIIKLSHELNDTWTAHEYRKKLNVLNKINDK